MATTEAIEGHWGRVGARGFSVYAPFVDAVQILGALVRQRNRHSRSPVGKWIDGRASTLSSSVSHEAKVGE